MEHERQHRAFTGTSDEISRALRSSWVAAVAALNHPYRSCNKPPNESVTPPIDQQCFVCQALAALAVVLPDKQSMVPDEWGRVDV